MTKATITPGAFATLLAVTAALGACGPEQDVGAVATSPDVAASTASVSNGFLYGRVTTDRGEVYEGRLRFGGDEETLWGNYFNGVKRGNPWVDRALLRELPSDRVSLDLFGFEIGWGPGPDLGRPFMARFGDITRLEAKGRDLWVTLKSGTVVLLNRYAADDYADGVRVWDASRGVVDLTERHVRSIELFRGAPHVGGEYPLHGTVRTRHGGHFTGLIQWDRKATLGSDQIYGVSSDGEVALRFDGVRSVVRSNDGARVTLLDGSEVVLSASRADKRVNSGMYVDDARYGRVLVSWDAFDRVDFTPAASVPAYDDFSPGRPLNATVVTGSGRRLAGRLVYDLDESETTETLDAPWEGVDYTIPFGLISEVELGQGDEQAARVTLLSGEQLQLERWGDLAESNIGVLIFSEARTDPDFVPWADIERIRFDRPPEI